MVAVGSAHSAIALGRGDGDLLPSTVRQGLGDPGGLVHMLRGTKKKLGELTKPVLAAAASKSSDIQPVVRCLGAGGWLGGVSVL